jgi:hypothetical protein
MPRFLKSERERAQMFGYRKVFHSLIIMSRPRIVNRFHKRAAHALYMRVFPPFLLIIINKRL